MRVISGEDIAAQVNRALWGVAVLVLFTRSPNRCQPRLRCANGSGGTEQVWRSQTCSVSRKAVPKSFRTDVNSHQKFFGTKPYLTYPVDPTVLL
jgi:hypothetical protein